MNDWQQIEQDAAEWLTRRDGESWSEEDATALDRWLDNPANRVSFLRLESVWQRLDRAAALRSPDFDATARERRGALKRWLPLAMAASLAGAIGLYTFHDLRTSQAPTAYATAIGEIRNVKLADGSSVDLGTATRLRADVTDDKRVLWLDEGEAFFAVAHDASRPFVIHAGKQQVTVLGTRFSMRREQHELRVSVLEGRVRLGPDGGRNNAVELGAGGVAIATDTSTLVGYRPVSSIEDSLGWRNSTLVFDQSPLEDVVREFNRYNRRKLVIVDSSVKTMHIGGRFAANDVEQFARLLENGFSLKVEYRDDEIRIGRPAL